MRVSHLQEAFLKWFSNFSKSLFAFSRSSSSDLTLVPSRPRALTKVKVNVGPRSTCGETMRRGQRKEVVPSGQPGRLRARPQPSAKDSFPLISCELLQKRGRRGALAAVCTSTLKSASKKHQNCPPTYLSTAYGTLKVVKETVYMCVCVLSPSGKNILQSLVRNPQARASNERVSPKFVKGSNPFSDILSAI